MLPFLFPSLIVWIERQRSVLSTIFFNKRCSQTQRCAVPFSGDREMWDPERVSAPLQPPRNKVTGLIWWEQMEEKLLPQNQQQTWWKQHREKRNRKPEHACVSQVWCYYAQNFTWLMLNLLKFSQERKKQRERETKFNRTAMWRPYVVALFLFVPFKKHPGTSLMTHWLRVCFPMQGL